MKFINITLTFLFFSNYIIVAQMDTIPTSDKKTGFSWGLIPALSYDSDLGVKYGAIINLFDYGKNQNKDTFDQYLYLKLTNTTKRTSQVQALLESRKIVKNAITMAEVAFFVDKKLDFFGFNGSKTNFGYDYIDDDSPDFINKTFYSYQRQYLRLRFDIQKFLSDEKYRLLAGISYQKYIIDPEENENANPNIFQDNLYSNYLQWNAIPEDEITGGELLNFTLGFIFDTRNDKFFCTDGVWFEAMLVYSPSLLGNDSYLKSVVTHRYYRDWFGDKLSFSSRLSLQNKLYGNIPFYNLSTYYDSRMNQEGIGGAYTLRGAMRNRVIADGFALANIEIKAKISEFRFLNQDFMVAASVFSDISYVLQEYNADLSQVPTNYKSMFFNNENQKLNFSYGPGLYIIFNRNNVITVNYGISHNKQLGNSGLYVGSSLLF